MGAQDYGPITFILNAVIKSIEGQMEIDENKIDDVVLALLFLTLHDGLRAWKGFDYDTMNRLHRKGYIQDPINKAKSVVLTPEGLSRSKELFERLFTSA